jgi:hypothetical protein
MDDDIPIATFTSITGASHDVAKRYLGITDNNTEQAIQLFFDSPDLASGPDHASQSAPPPIPSTTRPPNTASFGREDSHGVVHVDSDEEDMDIDDSHLAATQAEAVGRAADYEDDEAVARRIQEELYAGGDSAGGFDNDGVRAPIARTMETLVGGPGGDWPSANMEAAVLEQMRARHQPRPGRHQTEECSFHKANNFHSTGRCFQSASCSLYMGRIFRCWSTSSRSGGGYGRSIRAFIKSCTPCRTI